jgi:hypothetical protein
MKLSSLLLENETATVTLQEIGEQWDAVNLNLVKDAVSMEDVKYICSSHTRGRTQIDHMFDRASFKNFLRRNIGNILPDRFYSDDSWTRSGLTVTTNGHTIAVLKPNEIRL